MKVTGTVADVSLLDKTITFKLDEQVPQECQNWGEKTLIINVETFRNRRGRDANACLWWCLTRIADVINVDKWEVYLQMLKRYGVVGDVVTMKADGVQKFKSVWRECEEVGSRCINGTTYVSLLPYYGSSTYDTAEFTRLLDGVISEMVDLHLTPPLPQEVRRALENWEHKKK